MKRAASARRCGSGAGPDRGRYQCPRRRSSDAFGAQDRRPEGRWRADPPRRAASRRSADPWRRPGARSARRDRERRRRLPALALRQAVPQHLKSRRCTRVQVRNRLETACARPRRTSSFSARARPGCRTRPCSAMPGLRAETAIIAFDLAGVAVSSGSACSSGKVAALARAGAPWGSSRRSRAARSGFHWPRDHRRGR